MTARKNGRRQPGKTTVQRQRRSDEYKAEAVKLADRVGVPDAAEQLGIQPASIYNWRAKLRREETSSVAENRLELENARLRRELAEQKEELALLKKASAYFARNQK